MLKLSAVREVAVRLNGLDAMGEGLNALVIVGCMVSDLNTKHIINPTYFPECTTVTK